MTEFAKQVAKHLDRRQQRRRLVVLGTMLAAVIAAALYLRCGRGWGIGGEGGDTSAGRPATGSAARRCSIRVAASGITVDGKSMTKADAVAACGAMDGADVVVTGDARQGDWDALRSALDSAHVPVFVHESAHHQP
jgi:hypothetical protein